MSAGIIAVCIISLQKHQILTDNQKIQTNEKKYNEAQLYCIAIQRQLIAKELIHDIMTFLPQMTHYIYNQLQNTNQIKINENIYFDTAHMAKYKHKYISIWKVIILSSFLFFWRSIDSIENKFLEIIDYIITLPKIDKLQFKNCSITKQINQIAETILQNKNKLLNSIFNQLTYQQIIKILLNPMWKQYLKQSKIEMNSINEFLNNENFSVHYIQSIIGYSNYHPRNCYYLSPLFAEEIINNEKQNIEQMFKNGYNPKITTINRKSNIWKNINQNQYNSNYLPTITPIQALENNNGQIINALKLYKNKSNNWNKDISQFKTNQLKNSFDIILNILEIPTKIKTYICQNIVKFLSYSGIIQETEVIDDKNTNTNTKELILCAELIDTSPVIIPEAIFIKLIKNLNMTAYNNIKNQLQTDEDEFFENLAPKNKWNEYLFNQNNVQQQKSILLTVNYLFKVELCGGLAFLKQIHNVEILENINWNAISHSYKKIINYVNPNNDKLTINSNKIFFNEITKYIKDAGVLLSKDNHCYWTLHYNVFNQNFNSNLSQFSKRIIPYLYNKTLSNNQNFIGYNNKLHNIKDLSILISKNCADIPMTNIDYNFDFIVDELKIEYEIIKPTIQKIYQFITNILKNKCFIPKFVQLAYQKNDPLISKKGYALNQINNNLDIEMNNNFIDIHNIIDITNDHNIIDIDNTIDIELTPPTKKMKINNNNNNLTNLIPTFEPFNSIHPLIKIEPSIINPQKWFQNLINFPFKQIKISQILVNNMDKLKKSVNVLDIIIFHCLNVLSKRCNSEKNIIKTVITQTSKNKNFKFENNLEIKYIKLLINDNNFWPKFAASYPNQIQQSLNTFPEEKYQIQYGYQNKYKNTNFENKYNDIKDKIVQYHSLIELFKHLHNNPLQNNKEEIISMCRQMEIRYGFNHTFTNNTFNFEYTNIKEEILNSYSQTEFRNAFYIRNLETPNHNNNQEYKKILQKFSSPPELIHKKPTTIYNETLIDLNLPYLNNKQINIDNNSQFTDNSSITSFNNKFSNLELNHNQFDVGLQVNNKNTINNEQIITFELPKLEEKKDEDIIMHNNSLIFTKKSIPPPIPKEIKFSKQLCQEKYKIHESFFYKHILPQIKAKNLQTKHLSKTKVYKKADITNEMYMVMFDYLKLPKIDKMNKNYYKTSVLNELKRQGNSKTKQKKQVTLTDIGRHPENKCNIFQLLSTRYKNANEENIRIHIQQQIKTTKKTHLKNIVFGLMSKYNKKPTEFQNLITNQQWFPELNDPYWIKLIMLSLNISVISIVTIINSKQYQFKYTHYLNNPTFKPNNDCPSNFTINVHIENKNMFEIINHGNGQVQQLKLSHNKIENKKAEYLQIKGYLIQFDNEQDVNIVGQYIYYDEFKIIESEIIGYINQIFQEKLIKQQFEKKGIPGIDTYEQLKNKAIKNLSIAVKQRAEPSGPKNYGHIMDCNSLFQNKIDNYFHLKQFRKLKNSIYYEWRGIIKQRLFLNTAIDI